MADLKEISERRQAAFNAHDAAALAELDDANVVFTAPGPSGRTELRGREAAREYNTGAWKTGTGDMPATGKKLKGQYCQVSVVKDGLVVSSNPYLDQLEVMTQMGLMQAPAEARA